MPDNAKVAVIKACLYDPWVNRSYAEMAAHYGSAVLPARLRKPRDKAKVERAVLIVERWLFGRLRHRTGDLPRAHAARVHRYNLVIEAGKTPLVLGNTIGNAVAQGISSQGNTAAQGQSGGGGEDFSDVANAPIVPLSAGALEGEADPVMQARFESIYGSPTLASYTTGSTEAEPTIDEVNSAFDLAFGTDGDGGLVGEVTDDSPSINDQNQIIINGHPGDVDAATVDAEFDAALGSGATQSSSSGTGLLPGVANLLARIATAESPVTRSARRNGITSPFDMTYGSGAYSHSSVPLTQMTISQVSDLQAQMLKAEGLAGVSLKSSAVGAYQFMDYSLVPTAKALGFSMDDVFDEDAQMQFAQYRLEQRGLNDYLSGNISPSQFQYNLAKEWASIAVPAGYPVSPRIGGYISNGNVTYYGQHLGTTTSQIQQAILSLPRK